MADSNRQNYLFKFGEIKCSDIGTPQKGVVPVHPAALLEYKAPHKSYKNQVQGEGYADSVVEATVAVGDEMARMQESSTRGPDLLPLSEGEKTDINIVKDFPWTKTSKTSIIRKHTPTITLEETISIKSCFF